MKKVLAILLAGILSLTMVACGSDKTESSSGDSNSSATDTVDVSQTGTGESSQAESDKPSQPGLSEPEEEKWVLVAVEQPVTEYMLPATDGAAPGDPYASTIYAYNEKGDVIRKVTTIYTDDWMETQSHERTYNEQGDEVFCLQTTRTQTSYDDTTKTSTQTHEYTYDDNGKISQKVDKMDGAVKKVTRYERDNQGRVIRLTEADTESDMESGARRITETEYGSKYRSKVTEWEYNADNTLHWERYSLYDEYGSITSSRYTYTANNEDPGYMDRDYVYERDSSGHILLSTETRNQGAVQVIEQSFDENGHAIYYKITLTTPENGSNVNGWWTREYDEDGHSYTEKSLALYDNPGGLDVKAGDVTYINHYKYLPLSEAIAQQDISGEVTYESPAESSGGAEVYAGPYGSTLTKISDEGNWGTWKLVILKGDRRYEDTITFEVKNYVNSQTGQYNGMYERTENTYKITFNQSEAMFALGPEYGVMEFVRR